MRKNCIHASPASGRRTTLPQKKPRPISPKKGARRLKSPTRPDAGGTRRGGGGGGAGGEGRGRVASPTGADRGWLRGGGGRTAAFLQGFRSARNVTFGAPLDRVGSL